MKEDMLLFIQDSGIYGYIYNCLYFQKVEDKP